VVKHRGTRPCFRWLLRIGINFKHKISFGACVYNFIFKLGFVDSLTLSKFSFYCVPFELVKMELNPWAC